MQEESNSITLEDKCKWGESFIFVYDVTDKYSFDQLRQLKFIASYTHSHMRVNFSPCWVLVGNKVDLAQNERMVSYEEGQQLSRELGCHFFREISTRESINEPTQVFEDLWREFSRRSPRSPSSSQRKKFSYRIQDKIQVLSSDSSACAAEAVKSFAVANRSHSLRRQHSTPVLPLSIRLSKAGNCNDNNNNKTFQKRNSLDKGRDIMRIPEADGEDSDSPATPPPYSKPPRGRRNALISVPQNFARQNNRQDGRRAPLLKATSADSVYSSSEQRLSVPSDTSTTFSSSSTSSSTTSLNGTLLPNTNDRLKLQIPLRVRSSSDVGQNEHANAIEGFVPLYASHQRARKMRRGTPGKCRRSVSPIPILPLKATYEVGGF